MRQGQQNRRGRGRGGSNSSNSNRKPQNPLSRNFESNGPDVKIRGTASQIAEKYSTLARDASSSGDVIMAENYLQHAEHYNRIIMAAQTQPMQPGMHNGNEASHSVNGAQRHHREMNGSMRDQPQPHIDPQPMLDQRQPPHTDNVPQPVDSQAVADDRSSSEYMAARDSSKDKGGDEFAGDNDAAGRRRGGRRRYPGGGTPSRASAPGNSTEKKDKTAKPSSDEQPSDEIAAQ